MGHGFALHKLHAQRQDHHAHTFVAVPMVEGPSTPPPFSRESEDVNIGVRNAIYY